MEIIAAAGCATLSANFSMVHLGDECSFQKLIFGGAFLALWKCQSPYKCKRYWYFSWMFQSRRFNSGHEKLCHGRHRYAKEIECNSVSIYFRMVLMYISTWAKSESGKTAGINIGIAPLPLRIVVAMLMLSRRVSWRSAALLPRAFPLMPWQALHRWMKISWPRVVLASPPDEWRESFGLTGV